MSDNTIIEAPLVLTLKSSDDHDAPWLVLRASNVQQLQSQLLELENCALFADVGRVAALFNVQARLGSQLGAKGLDPAVDGGSFAGVTAAPTTTAAPTPTSAVTPEPAKPLAKFPSFKAPAAAATPPPPAASAPRPEAEPPAAAPAANGFPAAPQWKKS